MTFPLLQTFASDAQTTDSASSAFAIYSGVKTSFWTFGFDKSVVKGKPDQSPDEFDTILKWSQDAGKDTGFVTTARLSHATPAALYAKSADRDWECDGLTPKSWKYGDISKQLIRQNPGMKTKVMLGGGLRSFIPESKKSQYGDDKLGFDYDTDHWNCWRNDSLDLIHEFLTRNKTKDYFKNTVARLVTNKKQLKDLDIDSTDYLMGL